MLGKLRNMVVSPSVEQRSIELAGRLINYTLRRTSRRRSIGLSIDDRGLIVAMPLRASEKWLRSVLQEKAGWVVEKLDSWQERKPSPQRWVDGAPISFRGETFILRVIPSLFESPPQLRGGQLLVHLPARDDVVVLGKTIIRWYHAEALQLFRECVAHYAPLMGVSPREVKLSSARTQWGSCTAQGTVRLNWQLIRMPLELVDYVVVHELAHLVEMNHSPAFWRVVEKACPDYAKRRKELRRWGMAAEA